MALKFKIFENLFDRTQPETGYVSQAVPEVQRRDKDTGKEMGRVHYTVKLESTGEEIEVTGNYFDLDNMFYPGLVTFNNDGKVTREWGERIQVQMVKTDFGYRWALVKEDDDGTWNDQTNAVDDEWSLNGNNYVEGYDDGDDPADLEDWQFVQIYYSSGKTAKYYLNDKGEYE